MQHATQKPTGFKGAREVKDSGCWPVFGQNTEPYVEPKIYEKQSVTVGFGNQLGEQMQLVQVQSEASSDSDISVEEDSRNGIHCPEIFFRQLCNAAINNWLDINTDEIMEKIVENYNLQPKKKKAKITKS